MNIAVRSIVTLALALLPAARALAWGDYGHRTIARIALAEVRPATRAALRTLLRHGAAVDTPTCKLGSLEDASVWPDCVRGLGDRFAYAAVWHYQNISVCGPFDIALKCPDGNCVTAQVTRQAAVLRDRTRSDAERLTALAFLTHFAGDMHQPVHIGDKGDRGATDVRADYGAKSPPRMNLHRIWDSELAERALTEPPAVGPRTVTRADRAAYAGGTGPGDVEAWARESWQAAKDVAYGNLHDYPDGCAVPGAPPVASPVPGAGLAPEPVAPPAPDSAPVDPVAASFLAAAGPRARIDDAYIAAATPVVRARVTAAGIRLARLLDAALAR